VFAILISWDCKTKQQNPLTAIQNDDVTYLYWQMLYLNKPITCWAPVHFTGAHTKFMTSYCWVKNTYYLPWDDQVPRLDTEKRQMVPYYQWIPIILLAQVGNRSISLIIILISNA